MGKVLERGVRQENVFENVSRGPCQAPNLYISNTSSSSLPFCPRLDRQNVSYVLGRTQKISPRQLFHSSGLHERTAWSSFHVQLHTSTNVPDVVVCFYARRELTANHGSEIFLRPASTSLPCSTSLALSSQTRAKYTSDIPGIS